MKNIVTIAVVDFRPAWGEKEKNLERIAGYVEAAGKRGADIVVLPEIALHGGVDELTQPILEEKMHRKQAETIPGPASEMIAEITKKYGMYAFFGMAERDAMNSSKVYNSVAICGPEGVIGANRKLHLPCDDANWSIPTDEIAGGNTMLIDTKWGPIGIGICYDVYEFPEISRYFRAKGARLLVHCTAVSEAVGINKSNIALQYHSSTASMYIATSNIFGMQPGLDFEFMGGSSIIGPSSIGTEIEYYAGHPFGEKGAVRGNMHIATVDLSYVENNHLAQLWTYNERVGKPDWRPDVYKAMLQDVIDDPKWQAQNKKDK